MDYTEKEMSVCVTVKAIEYFWSSKKLEICVKIKSQYASAKI